MPVSDSGRLKETGIVGARIVPVAANRDERGCLYEVFRESWEGAFHAVQWNVCASNKGVARGAHVHIDYDEFYTLPRGRVLLGLSDIRRTSASFGISRQFHWSDRDAIAVVVPRGVAHVVYFEDDSVLAFGLSGYWKRELDVLGCRWDAPEFGFTWPGGQTIQSARDSASGEYADLVRDYEELTRQLARPQA
jgi:dTDP-4-dehydrorhamnose 3,5-epimerase